jgi:methionine biosynthesis protein MetW
MATMKNPTLRLDHRIIVSLVSPNSKGLDLGCGSGDLLSVLEKERGVRAQGIEIDESAIYSCVEKGLSVVHGDIDSGLTEYPDKAFDCVILNQSLQQAKKIEYVLKEALRVGKQVIIGFPNFAHFNARVMLALNGRAPVTKSLPYNWFDTPNLRFLSVRDFEIYCAQRGINVLKKFCLGKRSCLHLFTNIRSHNAIFVLSKGVQS